MKTLDRARPYGEVHGEAGHCFEQDGLNFDADGKQVSTGQDEPERTDPVLVQAGGKPYDLAAMDAPALHALATSMGLRLHPLTGASKVRAAILAAQIQPQSENANELEAQMQG